MKAIWNNSFLWKNLSYKHAKSCLSNIAHSFLINLPTQIYFKSISVVWHIFVTNIADKNPQMSKSSSHFYNELRPCI